MSLNGALAGLVAITSPCASVHAVDCRYHRCSGRCDCGNAYPDFEVLSYGGVGSSTGGPGPNRTNGEPVGRLEPVKQT